MAINVRGIFAVMRRARIDDQTARQAGPRRNATRLVHREGAAVATRIDRCMTYAVGNKVVWTFRPPPTPAAALSSGGAAGRLLGLRSRQRRLCSRDRARKELAEHLHKGRRQAGRWCVGRRPRRILDRPARATPTPCDAQPAGLRPWHRPSVRRAMRSSGELAVRPPQRYRAVEVFTPQDSGRRDAASRRRSSATSSPTIGGPSRSAATEKSGIVSGRSSEAIAAGDALRDCARAGGTECAVTAIGPFLVAPK